MSTLPYIRRGVTVRILRQDIWEFRHWGRKRRPRGVVTRINGGYIYVRPNLWRYQRRAPLELYDGEIETLSP